MHAGSFSPFEPKAGGQDAVAAVAAVWLSLRDRGMSEVETTEFIRWLAQDARHAEVFSELDDTWLDFNRLGALRSAGLAAADADLLVPRHRTRLRHRWIYAALAAAAAIAVVALVQPWPWRTGSPERQSIVTAVGAFQKLDLPDGSVVQLNTDSAIEINFTAGERRVRLVRGEVLFKVAKNPARPFIVTAGQVDVRAVGTAFNVRLRPERVEVLVTEGRVRVDDSAKGESLLQPRDDAEPPLLVAGQRATIPVPASAGPTAAIVQLVAPFEVERALAWQERRLEFEAAPLREVVEEFNRYNTHKLVIGDPRLEARRFGGTFRADGYETFVRLLEAEPTFGITAERTGQYTILRLK